MDRELIDAIPDQVRCIMRDVIILHAEPRFDTGCIHYTGIHPAFDVAPSHCYAPFYSLDLSERNEVECFKVGADLGLPLNRCLTNAWKREQAARHAARVDDIGREFNPPAPC